MDKKTISQVSFQIEQIDELLTSYADLLGQAQRATPNLTEITALASVLHSFYNGIENILLSVAKGVDGDVPAGPQWHSDLLNQMTKSTLQRGPVLTAEVAHRLTDYLGFRHFYRHSYSFYLEWDELKHLIVPLAEVWDRVKQELQRFVEP